MHHTCSFSPAIITANLNSSQQKEEKEENLGLKKSFEINSGWRKIRPQEGPR